MLDWLTQPESWAALATLTLLETVLGIDNIIFISILAGKLPKDLQARGRRLGLLLAMGTRILLLLSLAWIVRLTRPWFTVIGNEISGRDLILIGGGLFLLAKATWEIHEKLEGAEDSYQARGAASFGAVLVQIALLDIVFSLDSVITAVGMAREIPVMILAVVFSIAIMMVFSGAISEFVDRHPTIKMLALSFLLLIGCSLVAEGFEVHIPKGYIYFAMAFSVMVEMLNLKLRRPPKEPVQLRSPYGADSDVVAPEASTGGGTVGGSSPRNGSAGPRPV